MSRVSQRIQKQPGFSATDVGIFSSSFHDRDLLLLSLLSPRLPDDDSLQHLHLLSALSAQTITIANHTIDTHLH